jgi:predicted aconitase with swiveling domain
MPHITLRGQVIVEGYARAEALVTSQPISFLGGIDPADGKVIEKNHELCGACIKNKALCFPHGHGSTVGSYVLYSLAQHHMTPKAIINKTADPVIVVGAIIADIPMIAGIDVDRIKTGDLIEVDAHKGTVNILERKETQTGCT